MTRQAEALFLAQKMGLDFTILPSGDACLSTALGAEVFAPHTDKAQWAEVVLWAAKNGVAPLIGEAQVEAWHDKASNYLHESHDNTEAGIMAATVTAICRALGEGNE